MWSGGDNSPTPVSTWESDNSFGPETVTLEVSSYSREPEEGPQFVSRKALVRMWSREAIEDYRVAARHADVPEEPLQSKAWLRERLGLPVRRRFKKRVCAGSQRYRVMVN